MGSDSRRGVDPRTSLTNLSLALLPISRYASLRVTELTMSSDTHHADGRTDGEEYHGTVGKLPDGLTFLSENRVDFWMEFREFDEPKTAGELADITGWSIATIYRALEDLEKFGLVTEELEVSDQGPVSAYEANDPTETHRISSLEVEQ